MGNNGVNIQWYQLLAGYNPMQFSDKLIGDAEVYDVMDAIRLYGEAEKIAQ